MTEPIADVIYLAVIGYSLFWLHEGAHYWEAKRWTDDVELAMSYILIPTQVIYSSDSDIPPKGLRRSAVAPIIWPILGIVSLLTLENWSLVPVFWSVGLITAGPNSGSDVVGIFYPNRFLEALEMDTKISRKGWWKMFLAETKDRVFT